MKTNSKISRALLMLGLLILMSYNTIANGSEPADFIINGKILRTDKKLDKYCKLELFEENKIIDTLNLTLNKEFEFKLKKNVWYTIRVTKEGFLPLLISFNTEMKENETVNDNKFYFETALIDTESSKYLNKEFIDFPVGLVALNHETGSFEAKDLFTQNYMASINSVTNEPAKLANFNNENKKIIAECDIVNCNPPPK